MASWRERSASSSDAGLRAGLVVEQHDAAVRAGVDPVDAAPDQVVAHLHLEPDLEPQGAAGGVGLAVCHSSSMPMPSRQYWWAMALDGNQAG
jgi:hypothetical protein